MTKTISESEVETQGTKAIQQSGFPKAELDCPSGIKGEVGATIDCKAKGDKIDGQTIRVLVDADNGGGNFHLKFDSVK